MSQTKSPVRGLQRLDPHRVNRVTKDEVANKKPRKGIATRSKKRGGFGRPLVLRSQTKSPVRGLQPGAAGPPTLRGLYGSQTKSPVRGLQHQSQHQIIYTHTRWSQTKSPVRGLQLVPNPPIDCQGGIVANKKPRKGIATEADNLILYLAQASQTKSPVRGLQPCQCPSGFDTAA